MTTSMSYTAIAGADTGAVLAATRSTELALAMGTHEARLLGVHLAPRRPALPVRLSRTWMVGLRAARSEWGRREPVTATVRGASAAA